jgi:NAD(P)-dependent dehydrogenase (short-subunit alcohol dehydrogenase family)
LNTYCLLTISVAQYMKEQHIEGSLINFGSIYGVVGPDFSVYRGTKVDLPPPYSAIKGGIINFSRHAASYFGQWGIRINTISPGGIFDNQDAVFVEQYEKKAPLGRMGKPQDIAPVVVFLASKAAGYITGENIMVDGGWTCI